MLSDGKVPGTSKGTRAAAAHGLVPAGTCHRILGREPNQQLPPLPNQEDRAAPGWTWVLEVAGGNKEEVGDTQGLCSASGTVEVGWVITREIGEPGDI